MTDQNNQNNNQLNSTTSNNSNSFNQNFQLTERRTDQFAYPQQKSESWNKTNIPKQDFGRPESTTQSNYNPEPQIANLETQSEAVKQPMTQTDPYNQGYQEPAVETEFVSNNTNPYNQISSPMTQVEQATKANQQSTTNIPDKNQKQQKANPPKKPTKSSKGLSLLVVVLLSIVLSTLFGAGAGYAVYEYLESNDDDSIKEIKEVVVEKETVTEVSTKEVVEEESAVVEAVKTQIDSVVSVVISQRLSELFGEDGEATKIGAGSGFIVSEDGFIITNRHVVSNEGASYSVVLNDGTVLEAEVKGRDSILDIAVLKVETEEELEPVSLGDSGILQVGQTVIAIGNSLGEFDNSVSKGIVSGLGRNIIAVDSDGENAAALEGLIQTDASINQGNSGGPLLDATGNVIAVNTARADGGENVGFAIPINDVMPILESVRENGKIIRPLIGVRFLTITPLFADQNNLPVQNGALISGGESNPAIQEGGPADLAGLRAGDIIIEVDGDQLTQENTLRDQVQKYKPGETVSLKVLRGQEELQIDVELGELVV